MAAAGWAVEMVTTKPSLRRCSAKGLMLCSNNGVVTTSQVSGSEGVSAVDEAALPALPGAGTVALEAPGAGLLEAVGGVGVLVELQLVTSARPIPKSACREAVMPASVP
jgi:hypothetical protein